MKIIVGLGNPGDKYKYTRHNAGFMAVDHYLEGKEAIKCQSKFGGYICEMHFHATKTFFLKPQSFMNKSGQVVQEIASFYKINPESDLLVIHDEIDLKFGFYKLAHDSSAAGHNGVADIIEHLGSQNFSRLRVGIESRTSRNEMPTEDFVLQNFSKAELENLRMNILPDIAEEIGKFIHKK